MGEYIYKVTAQKKTLADGTQANIAVFAYKPSYHFFDGDKINRRMAAMRGCHIAERYVKTNKSYTGRVVLGEHGEHAIPCSRGTFTDGWFDLQLSKTSVDTQ